ncbi:uncharacterized protein ACMZJ9_018987 [Mantella aurantiaca]
MAKPLSQILSFYVSKTTLGELKLFEKHQTIVNIHLDRQHPLRHLEATKMKSVILGISFFTFSLSAVLGGNTMCYKCHSHGNDYCKGEEHECPTNSSCMTIFEQSGPLKNFNSMKRQCALNIPCDLHLYAYASDKIYFDTVTKCCDRDLCNNETFEKPNRTREGNGPVCPTCSSLNSVELCNKTGVTICGKETDKCATLVGTVKTPDGIVYNMTARGCMSQEACDFDYSELIGDYFLNIKERTCYNPLPEKNVKNPKD